MNDSSGNIDEQPPFGAHRLPAFVESFRSAANSIPTGTISRRIMSLARRGCLTGRADPIDVDVFGNCRARLYPRSNRCEKRVFLGVNSWDAEERLAIRTDLEAASAPAPFVFVDGGANVGLYSLFVASEARRLQRDVRIVSVEPDPINLLRLRFNVAASQADEIQIMPFALGEGEDFGQLLSIQTNRGEVRLAKKHEVLAEETVQVPIRPLKSILETAGLSRVDWLKLDIEGAELPTLRSFFAEAPESLWPRMIILEVGKQDMRTDAFQLCIDKGYILNKKTHLNAILHYPNRLNSVNSFQGTSQ